MLWRWIHRWRRRSPVQIRTRGHWRCEITGELWLGWFMMENERTHKQERDSWTEPEMAGMSSGSVVSFPPSGMLRSSETGIVGNWAQLPAYHWDFPWKWRISNPLCQGPCAAHFIRTVGSDHRYWWLLSWLCTLQLGNNYLLLRSHQHRHLAPWNDWLGSTPTRNTSHGL